MSLYNFFESLTTKLNLGIASFEFKGILAGIVMGAISLFLLYKYLRGDKAKTKSRSPNAVVKVYNEGQHEVNESGRNIVVADEGNCQLQGIVAEEFNGPGGIIKGERRGGSVCVSRGQSADEAKRIIKATEGDRIRIKILGDQLKDVLEQDFKPATTIFEIMRELKRNENKDAGDKVILKRMMPNNKKKVLDDMELTVGDLGKGGDTVILWAEFPGKK